MPLLEGRFSPDIAQRDIVSLRLMPDSRDKARSVHPVITSCLHPGSVRTWAFPIRPCSEWRNGPGMTCQSREAMETRAESPSGVWEAAWGYHGDRSKPRKNLEPSPQRLRRARPRVSATKRQVRGGPKPGGSGAVLTTPCTTQKRLVSRLAKATLTDGLRGLRRIGGHVPFVYKHPTSDH